MSHTHSHTHHHTNEIKSASTKIIIGIILNLIYLIVELFIGIRLGSLSLIVDAGHNFSDVSGLLLVLLAFGLLKIKSTKGNTFGYRKFSILISVLNSLILVFAVGIILSEAIDRFYNPHAFDGYVVSIVALIGVFINFLTAYYFSENKEDDINMKGAYLHMFTDGLVSLGVIIGGLIITYTRYYWIDPLISIIIGIIILYSCWEVLVESIRLSTDAIPKSISLEKVKDSILKIENVIDVHHVHIRAISTKENAFTAHIQINENLSLNETEKIKNKIKHMLTHMNIHHSTLELETKCNEKNNLC